MITYSGVINRTQTNTTRVVGITILIRNNWDAELLQNIGAFVWSYVMEINRTGSNVRKELDEADGADVYSSCVLSYFSMSYPNQLPLIA